MFCSISPVLGKDGSVKDGRVWYTYWDDQPTNVIYTGVVNYLDYQIYAPCVAKYGSEYACGGFALKGEYREYGLSLPEGTNHAHALQNRDLGMDYIV